MTADTAATLYGRSIVATVRLPLLLLTADLHVVMGSASFYDCFGGTPETVEGCALGEVCDGRWNVPALQALLTDAQRDQAELRDFELVNKSPDGHTQILLINARLLQHSEAVSPMVLVSIDDVTERRRMARQLAEAMRELELRNRELQDFASVASHDLQEPLRKIQAFSGRLTTACGDNMTAEGRDYLARIQNAASRMSTLIHDLLSLTRVATRGQTFEPVALGAVAKAVVSDLEDAITRSGATVNLGTMASVDADPTQMRQLIQNLIANSIKFVGASPCVVNVSWERAPGGGQLIVEDNGIGFASEYAERIFDPFQRLHRRGEFEGTGIGLALCRRIMVRHGGTIHAASRPEGGARFTAFFPDSGKHL